MPAQCPVCNGYCAPTDIEDGACGICRDQFEAFHNDLEEDLTLMSRFSAFITPGIVEPARRWRDLPAWIRNKGPRLAYTDDE